MKNVYKFIVISLVFTIASIAFFEGNVYADDWDDAGKVLAGVLGGYIGHEILGNVFQSGPRSERAYSPSRRYSRSPRSEVVKEVYVYRDHDDCGRECAEYYSEGYRRGYKDSRRYSRRQHTHTVYYIN